MTIFDRWGETLFTTSDLSNGWDGNYSDGTPVPEGVYIYLIYYVTEDGLGHNVPGKVTLIR